jgi:hypothetical protein
MSERPKETRAAAAGTDERSSIRLAYEGHFASSCSSEPPSTSSDGHHVSVARSSTCLRESVPMDHLPQLSA